jgi:hypothetical protein
LSWSAGGQADHADRPVGEHRQQVQAEGGQFTHCAFQPRWTMFGKVVTFGITLVGVELVPYRTHQCTDLRDQRRLGFHGNHLAIRRAGGI